MIENDKNEEQITSKIQGIVLGIVTNNKDPENLGRVKVKFPWISDNNESGWARVMTMMASKEYGTFFLPEVGDEVAVIFEHGDIDSPYILGSLWNGENEPPLDNSDGENNIRTIKSRSGHEIVLDDSDNGKIEINTSSGHKISLNDSSGGEKIEIIDKSGKNSILLDSNQNSIDISSDMKLTIKSKMIDIEAGGNMKIKASGTLSIEGALLKLN